MNVDGELASPEAPVGGGGPGRFRSAGALQADADHPLPHPRAPASRTLDPLDVHDVATQLQSQAPPRPPPRVTQNTTQTINGMSVTLRADAVGVAGVQGARTTQDAQSSGQVQYRLDAAGRVTSFTNGIVYSVVIQTRYGSSLPDSVSAYGRGTTDEDRRNRDVSLGFHESCHRADYLAYLRNTAPPSFGGHTGVSEAEFQQAISDYGDAWRQYFDASEQNSLRVTDEVGDPTRTAWCSANPNSC